MPNVFPDRRSLFPLLAPTVLFCWAAAAATGTEVKLLRRAERRSVTVYKRVAPAVVAISCRKGRGGYYGTGVVVSPAGVVLTSTTVVPKGATAIRVYFPDGRYMPAELPAVDKNTETAVLRIVTATNEAQKGDKKTAAKFPFVPPGDSAGAKVGDLVYTAGNPFHTIRRDGQVAWSRGTISAIYRVKSEERQSRYSGLVLETDAAVNSGSDGGPLFDADGRLLGILSLCFDGSRLLGTAVPLHLIRKGLPEIFDKLPPRPVQPSKVNAKEARDAEVAAAVYKTLAAAARQAAKATVKIRVWRPQAFSHRDPEGKAAERRLTRMLLFLLSRRMPPEKLRRQSEDQLFALLKEMRRRVPRLRPHPSDELLRKIAKLLRQRMNAVQRPGEQPPLPPKQGKPAEPKKKKNGGTEEKISAKEPAAGVLISPNGLVLTSAFNVTGDIRKTEVELFDGRRFPATVLGRDKRLDVALLKLVQKKSSGKKTAPLPYLPLKGASDLKPGDFLTVLGVSAGGKEPSQTHGIISARDRFSSHLLQTDARLNFGNTGGPAVDLRGRFVGLAGHVGGIYRWGQSSGVGLIAPVAEIRKVLDDLKAGRTPKRKARAFLGVAPDLQAGDVGGLKLGGVSPKSAAAEAGLRRGDVIEHLDGKPVRGWFDLVRIIRRKKPGDKINIVFSRKGARVKIEATLKKRAL